MRRATIRSHADRTKAKAKQCRMIVMTCDQVIRDPSAATLKKASIAGAGQKSLPMGLWHPSAAAQKNIEQ